MAAKANKKKKRTASRSNKASRRSAPRQNHRRRSRPNPGTRVIVMAPKKNKGVARRRRSNPSFFGSSISPVQVGQYVLGGLIGVTLNRIALPMLPATITSSNMFATVAAFGIAAAEWWLFSMWDKNFGAAVGFGALMNAATQGLNAFVPTVGSTIGLSGRGTGDFVPARFTVPQNPILDAGVSGYGSSMRSAYPAAYALAA